MHDVELAIAFGKSRSDITWKNEYLTWNELIQQLKNIRRTSETMAEYDKLSIPGKGKVKDGPAFVGGFVQNGRRKKENVQSRCLITLDIDHADDDFLFMVELILGGTAHIIYSTHSHRLDKPKYRLVVPTDREMSPDEYAASSRKLAANIGMKYFDKTTFDVHRLMYLPSCSKDAQPIFEVFEGELLNVDGLLAEYADWRDVSQWDRHADDNMPILSGKRAQDPREKFGMIGLFCRAYAIEEGIEEFLVGVYSPGTMENRYTYDLGSSGNGLEVYPDQGLCYSHQESDPLADGRTHNLFDAVRIHKFRHLDERLADDFQGRAPSQTAMEMWVVDLPAVKLLANAEREHEFADDFGDMEVETGDEPDPDKWKLKLERHHKTGELLSTPGNVELLLFNGEWRGVLGYDAFGNTEVLKAPLPWRDRERKKEAYEPWLGEDDKRLQHWLGKKHKIKGVQVIINAFTEVTRKNRFHPIKEYLEAQSWDGVPRMDWVFIDYLGATDSPYIRQVTRKMLLAAVTRIYVPGCKFDEMLVLIGPQGAGKSSLLAKLGRKWFSDSLRTFENKEAGEHLQNGWIFEIGELSAMKKTEVEEVKAFLSKTEDRYRVAYDRQISEFPRKCVFFGTTNNREFLKDATGNRRFWPVDVEPGKARLDHWKQLTEADVGQIWAEAVHFFRAGESLALDKDAADEAKRQQSSHMEADPREGMIQEWLDSETVDEMDRPTGQPHARTCAAQIWVECLHRRKGDMKTWDAREICDTLRKLPGWAERKGRARVPGYGLQTAFERLE